MVDGSDDIEAWEGDPEDLNDLQGIDDLCPEEIDESESEFPDFGEVPRATHWPSLGPDDVVEEWAELRRWVEALRQRFEVLDHHVIPACWWRHNGHVEALVALRDHERVCYEETAPASSPLDWMRALRDISQLLSFWTGDIACGARHEEPSLALRAPDYEGWEEYCQQDQKRREEASGGDGVEGQ